MKYIFGNTSKMKVDVESIIKWGGLAVAVIGGLYTFWKFVKGIALAEAEMKADIKALQQSEISNGTRITELGVKHNEDVKTLSHGINQISERFEQKLERQDERHTKAFNDSITEVKGLVQNTEEKLDKLIQLILDKKA